HGARVRPAPRRTPRALRSARGADARQLRRADEPGAPRRHGGPGPRARARPHSAPGGRRGGEGDRARGRGSSGRGARRADPRARRRDRPARAAHAGRRQRSDATPARRPVPREPRGPHPLLLPEPRLPGGRPRLPREAQAAMARALTAALLAALLAAGGARAAPESRLTLPSGFRIEEFASGFGPTRFMTIDPTGTLLVSTPGRGRVVALPDRNRDGRADTVVTVAEGLELPHGLAFKDGQLYVAETGRVRRFRYDPATLKASDPTVVVPSVPPGGGHWTRTIAFGPDGRLYVSVGSSCNVCTERDPRRAAITRYNADGSGEARFATGLRNAVGLAFHLETGELWATVNERDWRGDDLPPTTSRRSRTAPFTAGPDC